MIHPYVYAGLIGTKKLSTLDPNIVYNKVVKETSFIFNIEPKRLLSRKRKRYYVMGRQIISYILRTHYNFTLVKIGKLMKRDHSTIINSLNNHEMDYEYDETYRLLCNKAIYELT